MPTIDSKRGVLVVRVVYDGAPMSGKTTSLRTLARGLGVAVVTPEEHAGRTQFFDWIDYVGGLYDGRQIRCQIVSVPGQLELAQRRDEVLSSADAVVLVADTRASELDVAMSHLRRLLPYCRSQQPPIGIVLQANKRDAPDRVERPLLQAQLNAIAPLAIVETVATAGDGIREAFVFAVRLALDRVRAFAEAGQLPTGEPEVDNPDELLDRLKALATPHRSAAPDAHDTARTGAATTLVPQAFAPEEAIDREIMLLSPQGRRATDSEPALPNAEEKPFVPDPMMPGGFIWPPVDGRVILHEVSKLAVTPVRTAKGDFWASAKGCLFHSARSAIFPDADSGRQALIEWARLHATHARRLSPGRAVILAEAGSGRFRLWQLVRVEQALREKLGTCVTDAGPEQAARDLLDAASQLLQARANMYCEDLRLPCTLWTVSGSTQAHPRFVGLMPEVGIETPQEISGAQLLTRELLPLLRAFQREREDFPQLATGVLGLRDRHRDNVAASMMAQLVSDQRTP